MENNSFKNVMLSTLTSIKTILDSSEIVGTPLKINDKEMIVPISRLTFGFGFGGSELEKEKNSNDLLFEYSSDFPLAGGSLGGLSLNPEAFLYINNGKVEIIKMKEDKTIYDRLFEVYKDVSKYMMKDKKKGK